jgi:hypothetical protein
LAVSACKTPSTTRQWVGSLSEPRPGPGTWHASRPISDKAFGCHQQLGRLAAQPAGFSFFVWPFIEKPPPVGCSPRVKRFPPRSRPEVALLCSVASSALRSHPLLTRLHAGRAASPFPSRPGTSGPGAPRAFPLGKVSDCARFSHACKPLCCAMRRYCLLVSELAHVSFFAT